MARSSARKMLVLLGSQTDSEEVWLTTEQATQFSMSDPYVYNRQKPLYHTAHKICLGKFWVECPLYKRSVG